MSATQYYYEKWNCTAVYKEGAETHNVEDYVVTPTSKVVNTTNFKISKETAEMYNLQAHNTKVMYVLVANQIIEEEAKAVEETKVTETPTADSTVETTPTTEP